MSEHQYVAFRAIDAPVSKENLTFMRQQSTRAQITPWLFENEYHFGDFNGDAPGMLRRGYDFHLHYANFGIRTLMIRLPNSLPDAKAAEPYFDEDSLGFLKDKKGNAGILTFAPYFEAGELDDLWDLEEICDRLLPLRAEILAGDLRPLYIAHLAVTGDGNHDPDEAKEAPIPAGLASPSKAQLALANFYGLSEALVAAAADGSPPLPFRRDSRGHHADWLKRQTVETKNTWLGELMADPQSPVRAEILAQFQKDQSSPPWPVNRLDRTLASLHAKAEIIQKEKRRRRAIESASQRAKKLAELANDPARTLSEIDELVTQRSLNAYHRIALLLTDLREALSGTGNSALPEQHARDLKARHPTLNQLTSELRRHGFLTR